METAVLVPLGSFLFVVLIVGIVHMAKLHDIETNVAQRIHFKQLEHQRKMQELDRELERVKQGR